MEIQDPGRLLGETDKVLETRKKQREEREEEFSSGSCRVAAVGLLVSFPEL